MLAAMGIIRLGAKPTVQKNVKGPKAAKTVNANETLTIDDFATAPLYWITGSQQVRSKSSLVLLVDNSEYAKVDLLPGTAGDYRFAYRAVSAHDLGTHTIALVLNGEKQKEWELTVKKRGLELIDTAA